MCKFNINEAVLAFKNTPLSFSNGHPPLIPSYFLPIISSANTKASRLEIG